MSENTARQSNEERQEEVQKGITKIMLEGEYYGWSNYGQPLVNDIVQYGDAELQSLAEDAQRAAMELEDSHEAFLERAEELGFNIEEV